MKIRKIFYILGSTLLLTTSCTKGYLDINQDPNKPTTAELSKLLSGAEQNVALSFASGDYMHQACHRTLVI